MEQQLTYKRCSSGSPCVSSHISTQTPAYNVEHTVFTEEATCRIPLQKRRATVQTTTFFHLIPIWKYIYIEFSIIISLLCNTIAQENKKKKKHCDHRSPDYHYTFKTKGTSNSSVLCINPSMPTMLYPYDPDPYPYT